jgi:hypothetical protein
VSRSAAQREVVIAYRGTEQVKWKDFVSDANLIPQALDAERTGAWDLGIGQVQVPLVPFKSFKRSEPARFENARLRAVQLAACLPWPPGGCWGWARMECCC